MKKDFRSITQIYRDMNKPQINEALANTASMEYGTKIARDEYAKDTPGQAPGDAPHQPEHAKKAKFGLSVDGIPKKGGEMVKPDNNVTTGLKVEGHDSEPELVDEKKKLDPVGQADADIDNDGDVDSSDKYLHKKRKAIKKAIAKEGYGMVASSKKPATKVKAKENPIVKPMGAKIAEAEDYCNCGCKCGKKICESCGKPHKAKNIKEGIEDRQAEANDRVEKHMAKVKSDKHLKAFKKEHDHHNDMFSHHYENDTDQEHHAVDDLHSLADKIKAHNGGNNVSEGLGDMVKKGVEKVKKVRNDIKNFHKTDAAAAIRKDGLLIKKKANILDQKEGFQVPEYSVFAEAMSVTLRPSKSQPGSYKVHSVGSKMKAHGGIKPGERVKDSHIDDLHDSGIKVKYHKEDTDLDEAGRWDDTTTGRRYRGMSPEEKKRVARTNALKKKAKAVYKGRGDLDKVSEAMSPLERKQAAAKIFKMHQAKKGNAQKAKSAAMRDSSGYKTSDDSHLDAKPAPKPKGKKGVSDTPHIVGQLRGVVDTKGNHKGVQFKDGSTHKVSADHAKSWLAKHDASKPADKMKMYKHHDSHKAFKSGMSEENVQEISNELVKKVAHKRAVNTSMELSKAHGDTRSPDFKSAADKQKKNSKLRFSRGATQIGRAMKKAGVGEGYKQDFKRKELEYELGHETKKKTAKPKMSMAGIKAGGDKKVVSNPLRKEEYTDKQVRMAKGIAFDKRHVGGDYTGAAKKMEKIKKGLSDHPKAKDALRRANEQKDFAKSLFQQEAIERRADRKTIIATDPSTGRKVVKMAPKKEIDVGKGKMA